MTKIEYIVSFLNEEFPNVKCGLNCNKDYELLIAVMLSAQTTDNGVNKVTKILFEKYPTLEALSKSNFEDVKKIIFPIGFANNKAKNVIEISKKLLLEYNGIVPNNPEFLTSLPGVGNKTKNVVLAELYKEPLLAVDTHVQRIAKRLNLVSKNDDVLTIENKLIKTFAKENIVQLNHQIIWFGRTICKAQKPECDRCKLSQFCRDFQK